jgi:diacylglycerol kinase family enzyme
VDFEPLEPGVIHTQIDGELHGRLPARVETVPRALRLLMPVSQRS